METCSQKVPPLPTYTRAVLVNFGDHFLQTSFRWVYFQRIPNSLILIVLPPCC